MSPSTRRAWIEILSFPKIVNSSEVALHPEGVDRNVAMARPFQYDPVALHPEGVDRNYKSCKIQIVIKSSRPPPGGRG